MGFRAYNNFFAFIISIIMTATWPCIVSAESPILTYKGDVVFYSDSDTYSPSIDIFEYDNDGYAPHIFLLYKNIGTTTTTTSVIGAPQIYTGTDSWSVVSHDSEKTIWQLNEETSISASIWLSVNNEGIISNNLVNLNTGSILQLDYATGNFSINGSVNNPYKLNINILVKNEGVDTDFVGSVLNIDNNLSGFSMANDSSTDLGWIYVTGWPPQIPAPTPTPPINPFLIPNYGNLAGQVVYVAGPWAAPPFIMSNLSRKDLLTYFLAAGSKVAQHIRNVENSTGPSNPAQVAKYQSLLNTVLKSGKGFGSFEDLKTYLAKNDPLGPNEVWHHVVGKFADNTATYGSMAINNTKNVVKLDSSIHNSTITPIYNSSVVINGIKWSHLRTFLYWNRTYEEQFAYGLKLVDTAKALWKQGLTADQIKAQLKTIHF